LTKTLSAQNVRPLFPAEESVKVAEKEDEGIDGHGEIGGILFGGVIRRIVGRTQHGQCRGRKGGDDENGAEEKIGCIRKIEQNSTVMTVQKKSSRAVCFPVSFCMPNSRPLADSDGSRRQHIRALGKKIGNNHDE